MSYDRKRAIELGSISANWLLLQADLSNVLALLSSAKLQQLQRVLDAAVVDPAVRREAEAIYRTGATVGGQRAATPDMQRQVDRKMREYIPVDKTDDAIRLDLGKLLDAKALTPITDNPDEAEYLQDVGKSLDRYGVWLRVAPKLTRDPDDPSQWINDGKHFDIWLSLGPRGDAIPTRSGRIDRDALIATRVIGADYWRKVDNGRILSALNKQAASLSAEIESGMELHNEMARIRREAAPGVVGVSDLLGGAKFPSLDIWEGPNKLLLNALELRSKGRLWGCNMLLTLNAINVRNAASYLNAYIDKTTEGAALTVKALKVARTAGHVAEVGLLVVTGAGVVAGAGGASGIAAGDAAVDAAAEKELGKYLARNPDIAGEINSVIVLPGPRGTVLRAVANKGAGVGFHNW